MNEQIMIAILTAFISSFSKVLFEKILNPYIPDKKKLSSYIKKFFRFSVLYALPIIVIIWLSFRSEPVDKYFVVAIAFNFFALSIHFSNYIYRLSLKHLNELASEMVDGIKLNSEHADVLLRLMDVVKSQTLRIQELERDFKSLKEK